MDPELVKWIPLLQVGTNAALTVVAIIIAATSLYVTYRNNFGWKPIVLITEIGIKGIGGEHKSFEATLGFEIWNRRKYPLTIREVVIQIDNLKTHNPPTEKQGEWHYGMRGSVGSMRASVIGPTSHEKRDMEIGFTTPSLDSMNAPITVTVHYYDPRLDKNKSIVANGAYKFHKPTSIDYA